MSDAQFHAERVAKFAALIQLALRSGQGTPQMLLLHLEPLLESGHRLLEALEKDPDTVLTVEGLGPRTAALLAGDPVIPDSLEGFA